MNAITTSALAHCRAGLSPSEATDLACWGRSISESARERVEGICAADREGRERARLARRAQISIDRMESTVGGAQ